MKDLYTFDVSEEAAVSTYMEICKAYDRVFQRIGVPFIKGEALRSHISFALKLSFLLFFQVLLFIFILYSFFS